MACPDSARTGAEAGKSNQVGPACEPDPEIASHADASEQKIIEAFIAGDMQAFKYVYNKYRERIFSYCLYVTGNKTQAEDAFQEVFIRVYQKREQLREANPWQ